MRHRILIFSFCLACLFGGCGDDSRRGGDSEQPGSGFVSNQRILYSDGLHSENTEMIRLGDRILLAFRGGEEGQTGSARARIKIFESVDSGRTFSLASEVSMPDDPDDPDDDRDIRDPKFVSMGDKLFLYAISRVPGFKYRDLFGEAWTVRAESLDGGLSWSVPVKTFEDRWLFGLEVFWGFWRFTKRPFTFFGQPAETLFATGYNDGDIEAGLFGSEDGIRWWKHAAILNGYNDVPSEAELQFFGDNNEIAVALVRLDNQGILSDGQTAICTSRDPFFTWECGRRIEQRLDGPTWVVWRDSGGLVRNFVFARKHLPCTFKRTAVYELRGDLTDPGAAVEVCEIQEIRSSGDTAYTSLVPLNGSRYLLSWYSSPVDQELAWLEGQFAPSDIWLADVDFSKAPSECVPPEPELACEPPPLPPGSEVFGVSGRHLLTLAPVIWPSRPVYFSADVTVYGSALDFTLQPLDNATQEPVGSAWTLENVPIGADGSFTLDFGTQTIPAAAYPVIDETIPLSVKEFSLKGKTTSPDGFCGYVSGYVEVLPSPSDKIFLEGSTFGATRITGPALPGPVDSCN